MIPTPAFLTTRTLADQIALSATGVLWGIDPDIQSPKVHQVSFGIQRELPWASAAEARYVGTFGRGIWRGTDFNQVKISPGLPGRLQPRAVERVPCAAGGSGLQPGVQPARSPAASR